MMRAIKHIRGGAVAIVRDNIDTDQIIPKQFLKTVGREGLGGGLFYDNRFDDQGALQPDFILNRLSCQGCRILVAGANFGCGSSREHAVWALLDYGFEAVIAPSFADIFKGNATDNGLLLAQVSLTDHALLVAEAQPGVCCQIDLEQQAITVSSVTCGFAIAPGDRERLLLGRDKIDETLDHADAVRVVEERLEAAMPWLRRRPPEMQEMLG